MTSELLKHVEGCEHFEPKVYKDAAGYWTIGFGHRCQADHADVTLAQAEKLLQDDLAQAEKLALHVSPALTSEPRRLAAITDFVFNLGGVAYATSTLHRLVNNKEWLLAAKEIQHWNHIHRDGHLIALEGLTKRRLVEADWLRTG